VLIFGKHFAQQRNWFLLFLLLTILASAVFFWSARGQTEWPSGSTTWGFIFGWAGFWLIVFEILLAWKKRNRTLRIGTALTWMKAHVWLGLLILPLAFYHTGFRFGGTFTTVLMWVLIVVIASGIYGLLCQQFLPRYMFDEVPAETIYSQIERVSGQLAKEADRLVRATCGPAPGEEESPTQEFQDERGAMVEHITVGAVRREGQIQGKVLESRIPRAPVPNSEPLRSFFNTTVAPYLQGGRRSGLPLQYASKADFMFRDLKNRLDPAAHETVDTLADMCAQRRQFDTQAGIHYWLHNWLWLHLPLSFALLVLLIVHIIVALRYW
jgi:hypothetical protein